MTWPAPSLEEILKPPCTHGNEHSVEMSVVSLRRCADWQTDSIRNTPQLLAQTPRTQDEIQIKWMYLPPSPIPTNAHCVLACDTAPVQEQQLPNGKCAIRSQSAVLHKRRTGVRRRGFRIDNSLDGVVGGGLHDVLRRWGADPLERDALWEQQNAQRSSWMVWMACYSSLPRRRSTRHQ